MQKSHGHPLGDMGVDGRGRIGATENTEESFEPEWNTGDGGIRHV